LMCWLGGGFFFSLSHSIAFYTYHYYFSFCCTNN
jgi:hypothetical protein